MQVNRGATWLVAVTAVICMGCGGSRDDTRTEAARNVDTLEAPASDTGRAPPPVPADSQADTTARVDSAGAALPRPNIDPDRPARRITRAGLTPVVPTARERDSASDYLKWNPETRTVEFKLIAGEQSRPGGPPPKSPFNFNGYTDGQAALTVPPGVTVVIDFVNKDGTPHSAIIIDGEGPLPNMAGDPAIPRAYSTNPTQGHPQEKGDRLRFTAPDSGNYRLICGVPGHALSGMWIWFKVDPNATAPTFGPVKS